MNSGVTDSDFEVGDQLYAHLPANLMVVLQGNSRLDPNALEGK